MVFKREVIMGEFLLVNHTADVGLQITADSIEDLFVTAAKGWLSLVMPNVDRQVKQEKPLIIESETLEELLVEFLSELNYLLFVKNWIAKDVKEISIKKMDGNYSLNSLIVGDIRSSENQPILLEIKAVTFYDLEIVKVGDQYQTRIIFDT